MLSSVSPWLATTLPASARLMTLSRSFASWMTMDPKAISKTSPATCQNIVGGQWQDAAKQAWVVDPLNGDNIISYPDTSIQEIEPFVRSLQAVPKFGLHNPMYNPERYLRYGDVSARVATQLQDPTVASFFARLIQRVSPKSDAQAAAEVKVTAKFFENFGGDQVRYLARGFSVPGDHPGQMSHGHRWPYGPVTIVTPFNFPLEIPALQLMGALYMGNKPLLHVDRRVSVVMDQLLRLLHHCGMPREDVDLIHGNGAVVNQIINQAKPRSNLFTGSQRIAEKLAIDTRGKIFLEDAGFDWKVLGPDVQELEYVAWQCDQDAYACSGQKCSAQSILFAHSNWVQAGLLQRLQERAAGRKLGDLTIGPVITWTTEAMMAHVERLLQIPGARVLFGARPLKGHTIPSCYGAIEPTAVFVPLKEALQAEHFGAVCTEVFGPFQVVTEYKDEELPLVLEALERMEHHLTAAVVSNHLPFLQHVLSHSVNGTTYAGIRARTTGAPQNHWFGPAGDPRGAGIGTPEAIRLVWSCHREIIQDFGPVPPPTSLVTS